MKFILFCVTLDLSDNPTEMRIVKNSIEIQKKSECRLPGLEFFFSNLCPVFVSL